MALSPRLRGGGVGVRAQEQAALLPFPPLKIAPAWRATSVAHPVRPFRGRSVHIESRFCVLTVFSIKVDGAEVMFGASEDAAAPAELFKDGLEIDLPAAHESIEIGVENFSGSYVTVPIAIVGIGLKPPR